jgi:hypothetical protein
LQLTTHPGNGFPELLGKLLQRFPILVKEEGDDPGCYCSN